MYSDGNVNWRHACARLELEHHHVTHQVKMFTKSIRPGSVSLSPVAGTQVLDRSRGALKKFLPFQIGAKRKLKGHNCPDPAVEQMLYTWCWRASLGAQSPKEFLRALEGQL